MWPRIPPHSLTTFELVPDLPLGWILVFLFYFSIFDRHIMSYVVCSVACLHFFSILQFYFHRTVVHPAAVCSDFTTYACAVFASSLTPILCSCAVNGISIKCAICLYPRGATLLIPQSSIPPIPHIRISCSRTHIQPFDVSLSQPVQPSVPVYKVTSFSCFRSPSQHLAGPFYAPFSTYVRSHQLA